MKVYISGPHAVGKTTVCEELARRHPDWWRTQYDDARLKPQEHTNLFGFEDLYHRQLWRCLIYAKDELLFMKLEEKYPVLIIDRHPIENLIYTQTFYDMKWITHVEYKDLESKWNALFGGMKQQPDILLLPPIEWQEEKIIRPKNTDDREKYREDDWKYLERLRINYARSSKYGKMIFKTDLNDRIELIESYIDYIKNKIGGE